MLLLLCQEGEVALTVAPQIQSSWASAAATSCLRVAVAELVVCPVADTTSLQARVVERVMGPKGVGGVRTPNSTGTRTQPARGLRHRLCAAAQLELSFGGVVERR